jgi:hypothetical protein
MRARLLLFGTTLAGLMTVLVPACNEPGEAPRTLPPGTLGTLPPAPVNHSFKIFARTIHSITSQRIHR